MKKIVNSNGNIQYIPAIRSNTAPKIISEYVSKGIRYYKCEGGNTSVADMYDKMFKVEKLKLINKKNYKGKNPDRRKIS